MKPFLVHYTYRERALTARVVGDGAKEAEARFQANHPNATVQRVVPAAGSPSLARPTATPRPLVIRRPVNEAERERIVAEARQLTAELRRQLSAGK